MSFAYQRSIDTFEWILGYDGIFDRLVIEHLFWWNTHRYLFLIYVFTI
jgi:hypothetical protein